MTKRRIKSHLPRGFNINLGVELTRKAVRHHQQQSRENESSADKVLESVAKETDLQEFLNKAELADSSFKAERSNLKIIPRNEIVNTITKSDLQRLREGNTQLIPRRPAYFSGSKEELEHVENAEFFKWRGSIEKLVDSSGVLITPFERNINIWRQLWRVIERSDIAIQIVDARNPLLFYNLDLDRYVKEVSPQKKNLLLINKSDLLTSEQINEWKKYFRTKNIDPIFWSAIESSNTLPPVAENTNLQFENLTIEKYDNSFSNSPQDLIRILKEVCSANSSSFVGIIGYPNVGKSSTINRIIGKKKTSVSVTPGKTKHFQTIIVDEEITLCDCPGLIMPSFAISEADMILNGILSISHVHDYFAPIQLLCDRIPQQILEKTYSIIIPSITDTSCQASSTRARNFLTSLAFRKGFMSSCGIPDCSRAARFVLSDVVDGTLKCVTAPPGFSQKIFDNWSFSKNLEQQQTRSDTSQAPLNLLQQLNKRNLLLSTNSSNLRVDKSFFNVQSGEAHIIPQGIHRNDIDSFNKKHGNKNKREKLRRVFSHLDC